MRLTLTEIFNARLSNFEKRAKAVNSSVTEVCRNTGIARATYERWGFRPPGSVTKFDQLEAELARLEAEAGAFKKEDEAQA